MNAQNSLLGRLVATGALVGICYAGILVIRDSAASIYAVPAFQLMDEWQQEKNEMEAQAVAEAMELQSRQAAPGQTTPPAMPEIPFSPPEQDWQTARKALNRAVALSPGNPELHANLGRLYQFTFEDLNLPLEALSENAEKAQTAFRQAARLRPTWAYHWWDIARTDYVLQRTHTQEFRQALNNTVRFGPWFEDVQLFATDMAVEHWALLDGQSRSLALANINRALSRNPEIVASIVDSYEAWEPLCQANGSEANAESADARHLTAYCEHPELRSPYAQIDAE